MTSSILSFNRYRKLARDVPQSAWTVACDPAAAAAATTTTIEENEDNDDDDYPKNVDIVNSAAPTSVVIQYKRKGRCSVEEIVTYAVQSQIRSTECRMHPCGREDINVRCLGDDNNNSRVS